MNKECVNAILRKARVSTAIQIIDCQLYHSNPNPDERKHLEKMRMDYLTDESKALDKAYQACDSEMSDKDKMSIVSSYTRQMHAV